MEGYIQEYKRDGESFNRIMEDLENRFSYHAPAGTQTIRYENIRQKAKEIAIMLEALCPTSRELSLAITNLEQCVFWANAAIARHEHE